MTENAAQGARRSRHGALLRPIFFDRPTELVARDLLGAVLECHSAEGVTRGRIVETEAYVGPEDPACHAAAGLTERTRHLYGPPGRAYVYFIYGVHWCVNTVTREEGHGSGVLIRALEPLDGIALMRERRGVERLRDLTNGPGKVCEAMGIDGRLSGVALDRGPLRISRGWMVPDGEVGISPRIGIRKAADWPLRFYVTGNEFVSRARAGPPPVKRR